MHDNELRLHSVLIYGDYVQAIGADLAISATGVVADLSFLYASPRATADLGAGAQAGADAGAEAASISQSKSEYTMMY